jgi:Flp pilus assembly protein TadD
VPALEAQRALRPSDAAVLVPLGAAYLEAGELAKAREALTTVAAQPDLSGRERVNIDALLRLVTGASSPRRPARRWRGEHPRREPPPPNTVAVLP